MSGNVPNQGAFKFVLDHNDSWRRTFEIKYHGPNRGTPNTVWAYHLGYNAGAQTSNTPAFIDIPKRATEGTLLFTGTLSGCSVIVTSLNSNTYRVFHDSREDSSLLYDNVEMAIDYSGYSVSGHGTACIFMQYRNNQWNMFVQLQTLDAVNGRTINVQRHTQMYQSTGQRYFPLMVLHPGSYDARGTRRMFDSRRQANREQLRRLAAQALPNTFIPNEPDGQFQVDRINLQNPAVRHSQAIREAIERAPGNFAGQYVPARGEDALVRSVSQWGRVGNKKLVEPAKKESESLDFVYLWTMQKDARGFRAVVVPRQ